MKLAEIIEACRKLRLSKRPMRFRPMLVYLVEANGMFIHPGQHGLCGGQTAWTNSNLWFQCHRDANEYRQTVPGAKVVKLNICAFEEPIKVNQWRAGDPPANEPPFSVRCRWSG